MIKCVFIAGNNQTLLIEGPATVEQYHSLLISTSYMNALDEPTPGNRSISITVFDGTHQGRTAVFVIVVVINDNPIQLEAALATSISLVEGGNLTSRVGTVAGLTLSDGDREEVLTHLNISLSGLMEQLSESVSIEIEGKLMESSNSITYDRPGSLSDYQVCSSKYDRPLLFVSQSMTDLYYLCLKV